MRYKSDKNKYITKDGIIKNKPNKTKNHFSTDPKVDYEFGCFISYLRGFIKGFPNEKIEQYFDSYIERMKKIKDFTLEKNTEWKGDDENE